VYRPRDAMTPLEKLASLPETASFWRTAMRAVQAPLPRRPHPLGAAAA